MDVRGPKIARHYIRSCTPAYRKAKLSLPDEFLSLLPEHLELLIHTDVHESHRAHGFIVERPTLPEPVTQSILPCNALAKAANHGPSLQRAVFSATGLRCCTPLNGRDR